MKVNILTTQFAKNYGAILQTYSLCRFLNAQKGIECTVVNYFPQDYADSWKNYQRVKTLRTLFRNIFVFFRYDIRKIRRNAASKFIKYLELHIPLTKAYNRQTILASPPNADLFIVGSDQVWNMNLFDDSTYLLDFVGNSAKRVAYAPSIVVPWKKENYSTIHPLLEKFEAISVREVSDINVCQQFTSHKVQCVVDPVFLHSKDEWEKHAIYPDISDPYIFCYFMSCTDLAVKTVNKLRELTSYPVVYVNVMALDRLNAEYCIRDACPREFLGYLSKAELICTNSFHGFAFSNIFRKNYCLIPKDVGNSRMESLMTIFGIKDRFLSNESIDNLTLSDLLVDYSLYDRYAVEFINKSKQYIINTLNENSTGK
jgi:hypothetical protein